MNEINLLVSLSIYIFWNVTIITNRVTRYDVKNYSVRYFFDISYFILMIYCLVLSSSSFLFLSLITISTHILFGSYVEFFRPDLKSKDLGIPDIMKSYWNYVLLDGFIDLLSFGIILIGAYNG